jgi:hypothetical protein
MAAFENMIEGLGLEGAAGPVIGIGALLLTPTLLPAVGRIMRPIAVGALRTGMAVYREASTATNKMVEEARNELEHAAAAGEQEASHGGRGRRAGRTAEEAAG